jgi:hypothetical protein
MLAKEYGQAPQDVAAWPEDWLAAAATAQQAEAAASNERRLRDERRARAKRGR